MCPFFVPVFFVSLLPELLSYEYYEIRINRF